MAGDETNRKKRKTDESNEQHSKRQKDDDEPTNDGTAGKIRRVFVRNFMCHDALEVIFNKNVNFIVGKNGSGKSAILAALTVGLGARANITSRGKSVKEFIKKGKNTATIEISLHNNGPMPFKPQVYGDLITVCRTIGSSSMYKLKNWRGETVSTKREELNNMLSAMNIQIDNPISILNQDVARTFLVSSKPKEMYDLFMKATELGITQEQYHEAEVICAEAKSKMADTVETLSKKQAEIEQLKTALELAEKVDHYRKELSDLAYELNWVNAITEESKLQQAEANLKKYKDDLVQLEESDSAMGTQGAKIEKIIGELQEKIQASEREVNESAEAYSKAREEFTTGKEIHSNKLKELHSNQNKIKRFEEDIALLRQEIHKLESGDNNERDERNRLKQHHAKLVQKLDEVQAMLRTKQTDKMHLEADKLRLSQELNSTKIEMDRSEMQIRQLKQKISILKQQSDNALTVFGSNIPRLLKRIDEEYRKGKFKEKPRGPIGAFMKMKDPKWTPAVESFLGASFLNTFCVDNSNDAKVLGSIMKEIFLNERSPQIIASKFYNRVHDVSRYSTQSPHHQNLLQAMEISDPIVSNCLIDQREIECVLLIPTSQEAAEIMSDASKVPRNCKRAFTQQADKFFPDPQYRSYGGRPGLRAKFLQVSTSQAIQALEEELATAENEKETAMKLHSGVRDRQQRTNSEFSRVTVHVEKLESAQSEIKREMSQLVDKIEPHEETSVTVFRTELVELERKIQHEKAEGSRLATEVAELEKNLESLESNVRKYRELRQGLDTKIRPLQDQIRELENEKQMLSLKGQHRARKLQAARQAVQNATAEYEVQQRVTEKAVADATKHCPRINTQKSSNDIKNLARDLKSKIFAVEQEIGNRDIRKELQDKEKKYGVIIDFANALEQSIKGQMERLKERKRMYNKMIKMIDLRVNSSFSSILALRKYKGSMNIDHKEKKLELLVSSQNDVNRSMTDTRSLSGGERSYSTVAFILALWEYTGLPFYFLDEFDVFMDKINRRVIMNILLNHTKTHPESQFAFLTPLDTSHILASDYITIHQLAPPERNDHD